MSRSKNCASKSLTCMLAAFDSMAGAGARGDSEMCDGVVPPPDIDQCPPLESRGGELQVTCIPPQLTQ